MRFLNIQELILTAMAPKIPKIFFHINNKKVNEQTLLLAG